MKLSAALTVTALLCASTAFAQQDRTPPTTTPEAATQPPPAPPAGPASDQQNALSQIFDQLNTSHTGKLTKEEAQAHPTVAANFDKADANHDGVLTKDEFLAAFKTQQ